MAHHEDNLTPMMSTLHDAFVTYEDPSTIMPTLEDFFSKLREEEFPLSSVMRGFLDHSLPLLLHSLLKRDFCHEIGERVNGILQLTLDLCLHFLDQNTVSYVLVYVLWDQMPFYKRSLLVSKKKSDVDLFSEEEHDSIVGENEFIYAVVPDSQPSASKLFLDNVNHFGQKEGFTKVLAMLESKETLTLHNIYFVCTCIDICLNYLTPTISKSISRRLCDVVFPSFLELPDEKFNREGFKYVKDISARMSNIGKAIWQSETALKCAVFELDAAMKLFSSQYVARRLDGLKIITHKIKEFEEMEEMGDDVAGPIPAEDFLRWLIDHKIFESLFSHEHGPAIHDELLKHAFPVASFMAQYVCIEKHHLDMLWSCWLGHHEATKLAVFSIVEYLPSFLGVDLSNYLFDKIRQLPADYYDESLLTMILSFTHDISDHVDTTDNDLPFGLLVFWEMISDDNAPFDRQLRLLAQRHLVDIITAKRYSVYLQNLIYRCIEQITIHKSSLMLIGLWTKLMSKQVSKTKQVGKFITHLNKQKSLVRLIVDDIVDYYRVCAHLIESTPSFDPLTTPTVGPFMHSEHLENRLEALLFICTHADDIWIDSESIDTLWDCIVENNPFGGSDKEHFVTWMNRASDTKSVFDGDVTTHIFLHIAPNLDIENLSDDGWLFCKSFMVLVNVHRGVLDGNTKQLNVVSNEVVGTDLLWKIAIMAERETVAKKANKFLITIYTCKSVDMEKRRAQFVTECMSILQTAIKQPDGVQEKVILRCLTLLKSFLVFYEDMPTSIVPHNMPIGDDRKFNVKLTVLPGTHVSLTLTTKDTIRVIRKAAADAIGNGVGPDDMRLIFSGAELMPADDGTQVSKLKIGEGSHLHATRRVSPSTAPKKPTSPVPTETHPASLLSTYVCFDTFFGLVKFGGDIADQVWSLLMSLPTVPEWLAAVRGIRDQENVPWLDIFHPESSYRLLYILQIVAMLYHEYNDGDVVSWRDDFVRHGGITFLLRTFVSNSIALITTHIHYDLVCLKLLLKTINRFALVESHGQACPDLLVQAGGLTRGGRDGEQLVRLLLEVVWMASACHETTRLEWNDVVQGAKVKIESVHMPSMAAEQVLASIVGAAMRLATALLVPSSGSDSSTIVSLMKWPVFSQWVIGIITHGLPQCRTHVVGAICHMIRFDASCRDFFLNMMLNLLDSVQVFSAESEQYFILLSQLLSGLPKSDMLSNLARTMVQRIREHPILEVRYGCDGECGFMSCLREMSVCDSELCGYLSLLCILVAQDSDLKCDIGSSIISEVFHSCLFTIPTQERRGAHAPPKCKCTASREQAFNLLVEVARDCSENLHLLLDLVMPQHAIRTEWNTTWHYAPSFYRRSPLGYVGLRNLGASCYMNSVLQQLFMHKHVRNGILSAQCDDASTLLHETMVLFGHLQESEKRFYDPRGFASLYMDSDGRPIDVHQQMDADEFFTVLIDRLETQLKGQPQERLFKDTFGLSVVNQVLGKDCGHLSEREESQYVLSLDVKNKRSIAESLSLFVEGETLSGDNQYHCEACGKKVDAKKRACLGELPSTLILHLKRFEFDLETVTRVKINDYYEFPSRLTLESFTKRGLTAIENGETVSDEPQYQLYGVLVHKGTVDSGHYYSYINDGTDWVEFNDTVIEHVPDRDFTRLCYGGREQVQVVNPQTKRKEWRWQDRRHSAYLLFYHRISDGDSVPACVVPPSIFSNVWDENTSFFSDLQLYDSDDFSFVNQLLKVDVADADVKNIVKLGVNFFVNTLAHAGNKAQMPDLVMTLSRFISSSSDVARMFIDDVCRDPGQHGASWLKQMLLICTVPDVRAAFQQLIMVAVNVLQSSMDMDDEQPAIHTLIESLRQLLDQAPVHWQHFSHYLATMYELAKLGDIMKVYMLKIGLLSDLIVFFLYDEATQYDENGATAKRSRMGDQHRLAPLHDVVSTIEVLVTACDTPHHKGTMIDHHDIDVSAMEKLYQREFYQKALSENHNTVATCSIAQHLAWNDMDLSLMLVDTAVECIQRETRDFLRYLDLLSTIMLMDDEHVAKRFEKILETVVNLVLHNLQRPECAFQCIQFLITASTNSASVRQWLRTHLLQFYEQWGMAHLDFDIRNATMILVGSLVDSSFTDEPPVPILSGPAVTQLPASEGPLEDKAKELQEVYLALLGLLPNARKYTNVVVMTDRENSHQQYRLVQYFQLLRMCLRSLDDRLQLILHFDLFRTLFDQVDLHHFEMDYNKKELMDFWCVALEGCPRLVLQHVTCDPMLANRLLDFYISLRGGSEKYLNYNQEALPSFYRCIYLCAVQNNEFLSQLVRHRNWMWAIQFLIIDTCEYDNVSPSVFDTLILCCNTVPTFTREVLSVTLSNITKLSHNTKNIIKVIRLCMDKDAFVSLSAMGVLSNYVCEQVQFDGSLADVQTNYAVAQVLKVILDMVRSHTVTFEVGDGLYWPLESVEKLVDTLLVLLREDVSIEPRSVAYNLLIETCKLDASLLHAVMSYLLRVHSTQTDAQMCDMYYAFLGELLMLSEQDDEASSVALLALLETLGNPFVDQSRMSTFLLSSLQTTEFHSVKLIDLVREVLKKPVLLTDHDKCKLVIQCLAVLRKHELLSSDVKSEFISLVIGHFDNVQSSSTEELRGILQTLECLFTDPAVKSDFLASSRHLLVDLEAHVSKDQSLLDILRRLAI